MFLEYGIALTGGIGSGKSTLGSILTLFGYSIIDADKIAHQLLEAYQDGVVDIFSQSILDKSGRIDRKKLGAIIFSDKVAREKLQDFLHPKIYEEIFRLARELEKHKKYYFLDIPLFFEVGGREIYNVSKVLLIYVPCEIQLQRILSRDNCSKEEALKKIRAQMDIEQKKLQSDYVIDNSKGLRELQEKVENFLQELS